MVSPSQPIPDPQAPAPVPRPRLPARRTHLLDELRYRLTDPRVGAVILGAVAIAAGAIWYVASARSAEPGPAATAETSGDDTGADAGDTSAPPGDGEEAEGSSEEGVVTVHVAGAVVQPGVIELPAGSRVIDAIEAVGGARPDGDLDRLNLAATLFDGQRVPVPVVGQPLPAGEGATTDGSGVGVGGADGAPLDLNLATRDQLEELPGIGPVLADAILAEREKRGGFQSVDDLKGVRGIGEERFADIRDLVTVG